MGKKGGKPKIEVTEYFLSEHFGICSGPVDALRRLIIKEKDAWAGVQSSQGLFEINKPDLFGGIKKEGGAVGIVHFLPGESSQVLSDGLAQKLGRASGAVCPGFRGITSLFFTGAGGGLDYGEEAGGFAGVIAAKFGDRASQPGFYWTANTPYLPGVWTTVQRIYKRSDGTDQWYPEKAGIPNELLLESLEEGYIEVSGGTLHESAVNFDEAFEASGGLSIETTASATLILTKPPSASCDGYSEWPSDSGESYLDLSTWVHVCDTVTDDIANNEPWTDDFVPGGFTTNATLGVCYHYGGTFGTNTFYGSAPASIPPTHDVLLIGEIDEFGRFHSNGGVYNKIVTSLNPIVAAAPVSGQTWTNRFLVYASNGGAETLIYDSADDLDPDLYETEADAYAAMNAAMPLSFTGYTNYRVTAPALDHRTYARGCLSLTATLQVPAGLDMNPAHIIHECLTNADWGMGSPVAALDDDAFSAAADTLYDEGLGLSMLWTRQSSIQDFVQEVLDHIQAVLFVDPSTGLLTLKLIRSDYDVGSLPELTPDNADLTSFRRKLWGDIINEITVTWTNPRNEQEETVTAQDDASMATQGGPVPDSRNYYGVRKPTLAQQLAWRDLRSAGQPLASCEAEVDRSQWQLRPASVVKLTWPEYALSEVVFRVTSIDYGRPGDPTIKLSLIEDVYGLDFGTYDDPPSTGWEDPSAPPEPIETVEIFTLPLFMAADTIVAGSVGDFTYPEVLAGVLATTSNTDTFNYDLWDEVTLANGSTEWQALNTNNIIGRGELVDPLALEATSTVVTFENITGQTLPVVAGFVIIGDDGEVGNEIAMVNAASGGEYTLNRGVLDTVPRAWPVGTPAWFVDGSTLFEDPTVRSAAETVDYKLLPRTSQGVLDLADASLESATLTERPWLPNRPANVTAYGEAWSSEAAPIDARARPDPWVTVEWANRNRLTEDSQVLTWTDATVTPETGQTTTIEVRSWDGATVLTTHDGLSGTDFDVPDASFDGHALVRLRVYSERLDDDGDFVSLQYFEHWVMIDASLRLTEENQPRLTEDGEPRLIEE